ncbi:transketolase family protein [Kocuria sp.]|uniref:transketolase family protein n=1 Tax=Kocuria sp. TaxID=1871328 RepID=UPI0026DFDD32|nr:transketolase C-terminal domain-containing protein [Kocuria sp.]MDO5618073.1 transketolase C-terminal domain-containing protein [Kocuria sp.]
MMDTRQQFTSTVSEFVEQEHDVVALYAEISGQYLDEARQRHPDRVINVGIREQLLVSAAAGVALSGMRPIAHTFSPFLVERAFEQIKLDFLHQGVGGVLVGSGGSFDMSSAGRTHQSPGDVAILSSLPDVTIHAPGTTEEVDAVIKHAIAQKGLHYVRVEAHTNSIAHTVSTKLQIIRRGDGPVVLALGPILDEVLAASDDLGPTVLYANQVHPLDTDTLGQLALGTQEVIVVEPWLEGTSAHAVAQTLNTHPHRLLSIGTQHQELRRYGSAAEHRRAHGLDTDGIRNRLQRFLAQ